MASKMVTNFRRSLSFPNPPSYTSSKPIKTLHVRSTSLPTQSHPAISILRHEIAHLHSWSAAPDPTSAWLCDGLTRLKSAHESLDDLLLLPQTRESLHAGRHSGLIHNLLEDFLRLVDVHGKFQTLVLRLREEYTAAQIAVRRKSDDSLISVHSKNLGKIGKEIGRLVLNLQHIGKYPVPAGPPYDDETEIVDVISDVVKVTVLVSASVFGGLSNSFAFRRQSCMGLISLGRKMKSVKVEGVIREFQEISLENLRRREEDVVKINNVSKKMRELEDCVVEIEGCGERAFRSLINTRVSLLNVITQ